MVLDFLNDIYAYLLIPIGIVAVLMGINRALKKEENESRLLIWLGGISGIILLVVTVVVTINDYNSEADIITNYTALFGLLLGMSLIARPFKKIPLAFSISVLVLLGLLYLFISNKDKLNTIAGIPLNIVVGVIAVIVLIIFIISFVQEQAIDSLLWILGWGPVITILGLTVAVQGITLILGYPNSDGILTYLPG